ncbi:MAG: PTS sugar transporter subunit IIB [Erysipelotrichales bacterium]|nr:PTS sugar transporter subunit IIB [Erysipelotrichales bacterium]MBQ4374349.1 PTS sugar transporter subunit IIB [Erysipelotrichales bacterium]
MVEIKHILCCCGGGMGSSFMVQLNIQKYLKQTGRKGIEVEHVSLGEISAQKFDLLVVARDIAYVVRDYPRIVELYKIMDMKEITEKMDRAFAMTEDTYHIK